MSPLLVGPEVPCDHAISVAQSHQAFYSQTMAICETASVLMATLETALSEQYKQYENIRYICSLWSLRLLLTLMMVRTAWNHL